MKTKRRSLILTTVLIVFALLGFGALERNTDIFKEIDIYIYIFIIVLGVTGIYKVYNKDKDLEEGIPEEDEFTQLIKYKTGHQAYMASMYMWLIIFIMRDKFPNTESMIGGGILISALIYFITKQLIKQKLDE